MPINFSPLRNGYMLHGLGGQTEPTPANNTNTPRLPAWQGRNGPPALTPPPKFQHGSKQFMAQRARQTPQPTSPQPHAYSPLLAAPDLQRAGAASPPMFGVVRGLASPAETFTAHYSGGYYVKMNISLDDVKDFLTEKKTDIANKPDAVVRQMLHKYLHEPGEGRTTEAEHSSPDFHSVQSGTPRIDFRDSENPVANILDQVLKKARDELPKENLPQPRARVSYQTNYGNTNPYARSSPGGHNQAPYAGFFAPLPATSAYASPGLLRYGMPSPSPTASTSLGRPPYPTHAYTPPYTPQIQPQHQTYGVSLSLRNFGDGARAASPLPLNLTQHPEAPPPPFKPQAYRPALPPLPAVPPHLLAPSLKPKPPEYRPTPEIQMPKPIRPAQKFLAEKLLAEHAAPSLPSQETSSKGTRTFKRFMAEIKTRRENNAYARLQQTHDTIWHTPHRHHINLVFQNGQIESHAAISFTATNTQMKAFNDQYGADIAAGRLLGREKDKALLKFLTDTQGVRLEYDAPGNKRYPGRDFILNRLESARWADESKTVEQQIKGLETLKHNKQPDRDLFRKS